MEKMSTFSYPLSTKTNVLASLVRTSCDWTIPCESGFGLLCLADSDYGGRSGWNMCTLASLDDLVLNHHPFLPRNSQNPSYGLRPKCSISPNPCPLLRRNFESIQRVYCIGERIDENTGHARFKPCKARSVVERELLWLTFRRRVSPPPVDCRVDPQNVSFT